MSIRVGCPAAGGTYRITSAGGPGTISASGTFGNPPAPASGGGGLGEGAPPRGKVKVFSGHGLSGVTLAMHDGGTEVVADGNLKWCLDALSVPAPSAGSGSGLLPARYTIAVYDIDLTSGAVDLSESITFFGDPNSILGCGPCGSGSGYGLPSAAAAGCSGQASSVALTMAPLVWGLLTAGLEFGRSLLGGPLALRFREGTGGFCVWDNGGDGVKTPHVELRCESPLATAWRLTIRRGSEAPVVYVRAATEWNPLTPNVIYRTVGGGLPAPEQLTLIPG